MHATNELSQPTEKEQFSFGVIYFSKRIQIGESQKWRDAPTLRTSTTTTVRRTQSAAATAADGPLSCRPAVAV